MGGKIITYDLKKVKEGYVARCMVSDKVTAFGSTKEEAGDNLVKSVKDYLKIFPEKEDEIFNTPIKEVIL